MNPLQKIHETIQLMLDLNFWETAWEFFQHIMLPGIWPVLLAVLAAFAFGYALTEYVLEASQRPHSMVKRTRLRATNHRLYVKEQRIRKAS
ncbi:MAG: hypothetical protein HPY90_11790 [Syntrophothermus sp.]|uniref:hypothetical protein n=1 Tax=Syntrophothermus sp. TaxID=2736299 RepID=UPI00257C8674|nr:hypothetical protein [Syntrophothermus sp.]NSW83929.1 hypothetical protein [Syntrophothermus sp.]